MDFPSIGLVVAAFGGFAVGLEREWSGHATGPLAHFGGVRTFTLLGGIGGLCGWLWVQGLAAPSAVLLAAAVALIAVGYAAASRRDIDATTEVGALIVIGAGFVAGIGQVTLASGMFAITALVLLEKTRLHAFARKIDDEELRAAAQFAVMAVVILPLLPVGPLGPMGGVRPRALWMFVLFFSGLSFLGYVARRIVGGRYGYPLAGLLGGLISSTNVTFSFARISHAHISAAPALAYGAIAASTMLCARVALTTVVLSPPLAWALWPFLALPCVAGVIALAFGARHMTEEEDIPEGPANPLQLPAALQMAAIFQLVLFAMDVIRQHAGEAGIITSGVVLGLTDLDALTISMAQGTSSGVPPRLAAHAVAAGLLANTALKIVIALVVGHRRFGGIVAAGLAVMGITIALAFLV